MQLNAGKSCVMWFFSPCEKLSCSLPNITINNITLKATDTQKYLELIFDCHLTWKDHVAKVCKKMSYCLYLVNSNWQVLPAVLIKLLLESLVLSNLHYALPVWGTSLHQGYMQCVQRLQNRAV